MVQKGTSVIISDNSGVLTMKVLQIYSYVLARVGDILLAVIRRKYRLKSFVKKKIHNVFLFARRPQMFRAKGFYYIRLLANKAIILGVDNEKLLGTRHLAYLTLESKFKAFSQLLRTCRVLV